MTEDISIERVGVNDIHLLQEISQSTFVETFAKDNSPENMKDYVDNKFSAAQLMNELSNAGTEFYFAKNAWEVIGYLKLNQGEAQSELKDKNTLEIERIYVRASHQGKYIGQLLFKKAINQFEVGRYDFVWLGVWEKNHKAIHFYSKNGFVPFDQHIFQLGDDKQVDIMMKYTGKD